MSLLRRMRLRHADGKPSRRDDDAKVGAKNPKLGQAWEA
jgi:hypothetical protein